MTSFKVIWMVCFGLVFLYQMDPISAIPQRSTPTDTFTISTDIPTTFPIESSTTTTTEDIPSPTFSPPPPPSTTFTFTFPPTTTSLVPSTTRTRSDGRPFTLETSTRSVTQQTSFSTPTSSTSSSSSPTASSQDQSTVIKGLPNAAFVVIVIIAGIVFLFLVALVVSCIVRKHSRQDAKTKFWSNKWKPPGKGPAPAVAAVPAIKLNMDAPPLPPTTTLPLRTDTMKWAPTYQGYVSSQPMNQPTYYAMPTTTESGYYATILNPHLPQQSDELTLTLGQQIYVVNEFDDGWALGRVVTENGTMDSPGYFPLLCIQA